MGISRRYLGFMLIGLISLAAGCVSMRTPPDAGIDPINPTSPGPLVKPRMPEILREASPPTPEIQPGEKPLDLAACVALALRQGRVEEDTVVGWKAEWTRTEVNDPSMLALESRQSWAWKTRKRYTLVDSARYKVLFARLRLEDHFLKLIQAVETGYWEAQTARRAVIWWTALVNEAEALNRAADELFKQGQLTRVDRARVEERAARIQHDQLFAISVERKRMTELRRLLGLSADVPLELAPLPETLPLPTPCALDADLQHIQAHATLIRMRRVELIFNNQSRLSREQRLSTMFDRYDKTAKLNGDVADAKIIVPELHQRLELNKGQLQLQRQQRLAIERRLAALTEIARETPPGNLDARLEAQRDLVMSQVAEMDALKMCYTTSSQLDYLRAIGLLRYAPNEAVATAVAGGVGPNGCRPGDLFPLPELYRVGLSDAEVDESIVRLPQR